MKPVVLVIDDDQIDRANVSSMIGHKYQVQQAASAREGLQSYAEQAATCVLLDYRLPDSNELETLDQLVQMGATVVLLTGMDSEELGLAAMRHGAQDYSAKSDLSARLIHKTVSFAIERNQLLESNRALVLELKGREQYLNDIAARISEGLWILSVDDERFLYASLSLARICDLSVASLMDSNWIELFHPDDRKKVVATYAGNKARRQEFSGECRILRPDGTIRHIECEGFPVLDSQGTLCRFAGVVRDVTESRRLQEELKLAQKLESVGQLAAGIAHEINTPSQYVSDNIQFVQRSVQGLFPLFEEICNRLETSVPDQDAPKVVTQLRDAVNCADLKYVMEELPEALQQASYGMDQIRTIVTAMKDFSYSKDSMEAANLNKAIESTVTVSRNEWKRIAEVVLDLDEDLPEIPCIVSTLNQVILNIIINAAHAIEELKSEGKKGTISIRTWIDDAHAVIEIKDTGCGMRDDVQRRIFDPFFTTKEVGKGTGQGLAIAYSVITEQHAGTISVESAPGCGSCFQIRLPRTVTHEENAA